MPYDMGQEDIGGTHKKNSIDGFDTRKTIIADEDGAFDLELTIAILESGEKIAIIRVDVMENQGDAINRAYNLKSITYKETASDLLKQNDLHPVFKTEKKIDTVPTVSLAEIAKEINRKDVGNHVFDENESDTEEKFDDSTVMMLSADEEENSADTVPWEIPEKEAQERGYPVLNGMQVVPLKTWVHAFDVDPATGEARNNYGLVVGLGNNGGLMVRFEHKARTGGENAVETKEISTDDLEAVQGAFQQEDAYLNQLMQQEPEERNYEEVYADPREQEEGGEKEAWEPFDINTAPRRAREFMQRSQRRLEREIAKALSVPYAGRRSTVREAVEQMTDEFMQSGTISEETMDKAFEDAYEKGIIYGLY